jgi:hypothetical protein
MPGQVEETKLAGRMAQLGQKRGTLSRFVEPSQIKNRQGLSGLRCGHEAPSFSLLERHDGARRSMAPLARTAYGTVLAIPVTFLGASMTAYCWILCGDLTSIEDLPGILGDPLR